MRMLNRIYLNYIFFLDFGVLAWDEKGLAIASPILLCDWID